MASIAEANERALRRGVEQAAADQEKRFTELLAKIDKIVRASGVGDKPFNLANSIEVTLRTILALEAIRAQGD